MACIELNTKVRAMFQFEVKKVDTGEVVSKTDWFPNLVLDQGLELLGYTSVLEFCRVGSGISTPLKSDTNLETTIATTSSVPDNSQVSWGMNTIEGYGWTRKIFRFNQGQAVGNISEVGVGGGGKLFNRALVKDAQGLFATVTVMSDETLDVTVELRTYLDQVTKSYSVTMSGVVYSLRTEALFENFYSAYFQSGVFQYGPGAYSGGIYSKVGRPSGHIADFTGSSASYSTREYVPGTKEKVFDMYWGLSSGNGAPLRTVVVPTNLGTYQTEFSPTIPKTSDHILKLTFKMTWDRYE